MRHAKPPRDRAAATGHCFARMPLSALANYAQVLLWTAVFITCSVGWGDVACAAERYAVKASLANVRANPDTASDTLWQVERYHPLLVVEKKGAWYRFNDFEGDGGWIHKSLLDKSRTIIIKVRRANIRSGPGKNNTLLFDADKGTPFKVLQKKGRWFKVQHADGDSGWIFDALVW